MNKYDNVTGISRKLEECYVCGNPNVEISWNTTFFSGEAYEEAEGYEIEVRHEYCYCNKCGYFRRKIDSDDPKLYESKYRTGIAIMKNPFKAIKQMLVLKKNSERASLYRLCDRIEYEPKIMRTIE